MLLRNKSINEPFTDVMDSYDDVEDSSEDKLMICRSQHLNMAVSVMMAAITEILMQRAFSSIRIDVRRGTPSI